MLLVMRIVELPRAIQLQRHCLDISAQVPDTSAKAPDVWRVDDSLGRDVELLFDFVDML